jgi:ParB-like nuclease domain
VLELYKCTNGQTTGARALTTNIDGDPFETQDTWTPESEVSARHLQTNNEHVEGEAAETDTVAETNAHESIVDGPNSKEIFSSQVPIDSIKIGSRFRKDLGDIASLAKDISEIGLLHPIVINQNRELISGLRRIKAFKLLGRSEIPARVINLDDIVKGEVSENTQRKDFSWEEIIRIKKAVEPEIKKESEKRMLSGKPSAKFADGSGSSSTNTKNTSNSENQTRAKVARHVWKENKPRNSSYGRESL